jgi:hypothetical protein
VFKVLRVWKGVASSEYTLLQDTDRTYRVVIDGQHTYAGCPVWVEGDAFEAGRQYIVFASKIEGHFESMGCGLSRSPSHATRKRLNAWLAKQKMGESTSGPTTRCS